MRSQPTRGRFSGTRLWSFVAAVWARGWLPRKCESPPAGKGSYPKNAPQRCRRCFVCLPGLCLGLPLGLAVAESKNLIFRDSKGRFVAFRDSGFLYSGKPHAVVSCRTENETPLAKMRQIAPGRSDAAKRPRVMKSSKKDRRLLEIRANRQTFLFEFGGSPVEGRWVRKTENRSGNRVLSPPFRCRDQPISHSID